MSDVIFSDGFKATAADKTVNLRFASDDKQTEFVAKLSTPGYQAQLAVAINAMLKALPAGGSLQIGGVKIPKDTTGNVAVGLLQKAFPKST